MVHCNPKSLESSPNNRQRKLKFQNSLMTADPISSKNALKAAILPLSKFNGVQNFREFERDTIVLLIYQVNEAFCCTKWLHEIKN